MKVVVSGRCGDSGDYVQKKQQDSQRLKEGVNKFTEALIVDAQKEAAKKSELPSDWRNRLIT